MAIHLEEIRNEIKEHNASSKAQAEKYEQVKCWSYAYLARWVVLEKGLKSLYDSHTRECIRKGAIEWIEYLDGKVTTAPNKIKNFTIQTQDIPSYKFISELLGACKKVEVALKSDGKYRPKRNRIAHKAEEFKSENNYLEYRKAIDAAIEQLLTKLSRKTNAKN